MRSFTFFYRSSANAFFQWWTSRTSKVTDSPRTLLRDYKLSSINSSFFPRDAACYASHLSVRDVDVGYRDHKHSWIGLVRKQLHYTHSYRLGFSLSAAHNIISLVQGKQRNTPNFDVEYEWGMEKWKTPPVTSVKRGKMEPKLLLTVCLYINCSG